MYVGASDGSRISVNLEVMVGEGGVVTVCKVMLCSRIEQMDSNK